MKAENFSFDKLADVDFGLVLETFQKAVRFAGMDCVDRPGDDRARKVTLQLILKPVAIIQGTQIECDGVNGKFLCKSAIPDYETREINFGVLKDGNLIFNPDSPRDHKQMTLIDEDQE